tara:strand:- start:25700 stop:25882 length:183 start_codon:yes stop_codon:yes gene_type:complete
MESKDIESDLKTLIGKVMDIEQAMVNMHTSSKFKENEIWLAIESIQSEIKQLKEGKNNEK